MIGPLGFMQAPKEQEKWIVCNECTVYVRESESYDGLCFWCTPEGKERAKEMKAEARLRRHSHTTIQKVSP